MHYLYTVLIYVHAQHVNRGLSQLPGFINFLCMASTPTMLLLERGFYYFHIVTTMNYEQQREIPELVDCHRLPLTALHNNVNCMSPVNVATYTFCVGFL